MAKVSVISPFTDETDPDTGEQKGLKLVMFDITNPTDLKAADSTVLTDSIYSPAAHE